MDNYCCLHSILHFPLTIIYYSLFFSIFAPEIKDIQRFNEDI